MKVRVDGDGLPFWQTLLAPLFSQTKLNSQLYNLSIAVSIANHQRNLRRKKSWLSWKTEQASQTKAMKKHTQAGTKPIPDELEQWLAATKVLIDRPLEDEPSQSNPDDLPKSSPGNSDYGSKELEIIQWPPRLQRSKKPHELCAKPPNPLIKAWVLNKRLWRYRCTLVHKRIFELRHE